MIKRYASLRFEASIGPSDFDEIVRALSSDGVIVASLNVAADRGYAAVALEPGTSLARANAAVQKVLPSARIDEPARVVLEVRVESSYDAARVREALGGPAGLTGVVARAANELTTIIELDETRTSLALVIETIDVEVRGRARRITPLIPLDDAVLARFTGAVLGEPDLDRSRLIETHLDALALQER